MEWMRFRPFLVTHKCIHARIADLTSRAYPDRLVWHPAGLHSVIFWRSRLPAFAAVNFAFSARLLVAGILLLQEAPQITAVNEVLFGARNTLQSLEPDPPKNSIGSYTVQRRYFVYRIGIVFPDPAQVIDKFPHVALPLTGGNQLANILNPPGRDLRA
jgi:hypothetical protein